MQNSLLLKCSVVGFHLLGDKNPTLDVIEEAISKDQYKEISWGWALNSVHNATT